MPSIKQIREAVAQLPQGPPIVVALAGGTTGIGSYVSKAFATAFASQGSKLRVYLIGRRADRAEEIISFGRTTSPESDWRFIQTPDASLMSGVDRLCAEIIEQEEKEPFHGGPARLDVLYMSQALSPLQESKVTSEGLDTQMSLLYYSRMRCIQNLTPLLLSAPHPAHVISIFAGAQEDSNTPGVLPIGTPSPSAYGITSVRNYTTFMKTFFFEKLAEQHAGKISFVHVFPGLVDTPVFYSDVNPLWFRIVWRVVKLLVSWYITSAEVCSIVIVSLTSARYPVKSVKQSEQSKTVLLVE